MMVHSEARLDAVLGERKQFQYQYTLIDITQDAIDKAEFPVLTLAKLCFVGTPDNTFVIG